MKRIGLLINPIAGIGGRVGLKGSDGAAIQARALELGAIPLAGERTVLALRAMLPVRPEFSLLTLPGAMGEDAARKSGLDALITGTTLPDPTSAEDTIRGAQSLARDGADLLLFTGGDGTARDIHEAIGTQLPVIGIPAGVKIHSAVYATHPRFAGELATAFINGDVELRLAEVMDLDEDEFRAGRVVPRLFGYLQVPFARRYMQAIKSSAPPGESSVLVDIARELERRITSDCLYILGPGSTTYSVFAHLGQQKTLLGVDALLDGDFVARDVGEMELLGLLGGNHKAMIIVTPIGGQGCIFGRGNQQISPEVIRRVGRENIWIISTAEKLHALAGQPLWADSGDAALDRMLNGYFPVVTGYMESMMYKISD